MSHSESVCIHYRRYDCITNPSLSLGTCINCEKYSYTSFGKSERLCDRCLKKLPRIVCEYCQKDFHQLVKYAKKQKESGKSLCTECIDDQKIYGAPKHCEYCNVKAAFYGTKCNICTKQEKTYGKPKMCHECQRLSAFDKGADTLRKAGGRLLCFLCTRNYKRKLRAHENSKKRDRSDAESSKSDSINGSSSSSSKRNKEYTPYSPSYLSVDDYAPLPLPVFDEVAQTTTTPDYNWRILYEEKEAQIQTQSTEFHSSLQEAKRQIAELNKQLEDAHGIILHKDRESAATNLRIHELEKDLHSSRETVKSLQQEAVTLRAELREKRPERDARDARDRDRDRDRDRERDRERDRVRDRDWR